MSIFNSRFSLNCCCCYCSCTRLLLSPTHKHVIAILREPVAVSQHVRSREYVARVLVQTVPELQQADAYLVMQKAHKQGMAVVGVWVFEVAELYCDQLKSGGLIASVTEEGDGKE